MTMTGAGDNAQAQIRSYVDRILRLKEEQASLATDVREIYAEAKSNGFDKTALGQLVTYVAKRAKGEAELEEREAMFDLYLSAYDNNAPRTRTRMREIPEPADGDEPADSDTPQLTGRDDTGAVSEPAGVADPLPEPVRTGDDPVATKVAAAVDPARRVWKHSDPAHPDCLNPSGCGGFSNLKLCERCSQAAALGQVA